MTINTENSAFKIYRWNDEFSVPTPVISYTNSSGYRLGDNFSVVGSVADRSAIIYACASNSNVVLRWQQNSNGSFNQIPEIIILSDLPGNSTIGAMPSVCPKSLNPNDGFYVTSQSMMVKEYSGTGNFIAVLSNDLIPVETSSVKLLQTADGRKLLMLFQCRNSAGNEYSQTGCVIDVTQGFGQAVQYGITPSLYVNTNPNATGDVCAEIDSTGNFILYVLSTNNGICAFNSKSRPLAVVEKEYLTLGGVELLTNYPNPFNSITTLTYKIATELAGQLIQIDLYNIQGQKVMNVLKDKACSGAHSINISAYNLTTGVYIALLRCGDKTKTLQMTLIK